MNLKQAHAHPDHPFQIQNAADLLDQGVIIFFKAGINDNGIEVETHEAPLVLHLSQHFEPLVERARPLFLLRDDTRRSEGKRDDRVRIENVLYRLG